LEGQYTYVVKPVLPWWDCGQSKGKVPESQGLPGS